MTRRWLFGVIAVVSSGLVVAAQQPFRPTGSGRISGRVLAARTREPIAGARVSASAFEPRVNELAVSDSQGYFNFTGLPAARYRIAANAERFAPTQFGQLVPEDPERMVALRDRETFDQADILMPRFGEIVGTVTDSSGAAVAGALVTPLRRDFYGGDIHFFQFGATTQADSRGVFHLTSVRPGTYYLSAARFIPHVSSTSQVQSGYGNTYYPATLSAAKAETVSVNPERITNANVTLSATTLASLTVTFPATGAEMFRGGTLDVSLAQSSQGWTVPVPPAKKLIVNGVPPGTYFIIAREGDARTITNAFAGKVVVEEGSREVSVQMVAQRKVKVSGRIVFDTPAARSRLDPSVLTIGIGVLGLGRSPGPQGPAGIPSADLSFATQSWPGLHEVRLEARERGWAIKSVHAGGNDVTDTGIVVPNATDLSGVEVELTNQLIELSGHVTAKGAAVDSYKIFVFAHDRKRWQTATQRYTATASADQNGQFVVRGLPAGLYFVIAVPNGPSRPDPQELERFAPLASTVSLAEGQARSIALELATLASVF